MKGNTMKHVIIMLQMEFGSLVELANKLGVTRNTVYQWQRLGHVPIRYVKKIAELSEGRILIEDLRPDLFA
jgi:DNA-binding transcriptional regulator YdaS (Cro superfamily)